jgi:hypothetical protein
MLDWPFGAFKSLFVDLFEKISQKSFSSGKSWTISIRDRIIREKKPNFFIRRKHVKKNHKR